MQTTIKSQKDFNCKRHKYTENVLSYYHNLGSLRYGDNPEEEYANVIATSNHLEIICFITGRGYRSQQKLFWLSVQGRTLSVYSQDPDGAEQGLLAANRGEKRGKRYDMGSERSGEHLRYITQPWFQDDLGVVRPEF